MEERKQREEEGSGKNTVKFYQIDTLHVRLKLVFSSIYIKRSRCHVQNFPSHSNGLIHAFERLWYQPALCHQNVGERDRDIAESTSKLGNASFRIKNDVLTLPTAYKDITRFESRFRNCSPF
jgi:hypothetical protein